MSHSNYSGAHALNEEIEDMSVIPRSAYSRMERKDTRDSRVRRDVLGRTDKQNSALDNFRNYHRN